MKNPKWATARAAAEHGTSQCNEVFSERKRGSFLVIRTSRLPRIINVKEYEQMITGMTTSVTISRLAARHRHQNSLKACRRQLGIAQFVRCGTRDICKCIVASVPEHLRVRLKGPPRSPRPLRSRATRSARWRGFAHNYPPAPGKKQRTCVVPSVSKYGHTTAGPKRFGSVTTVSSGTGTHSP